MHRNDGDQVYTLNARERTEDVAYHLLFRQESRVTVFDSQKGVNIQFMQLRGNIEHAMATLASRVEVLEKHMTSALVTHDISTPHKGGANSPQATRQQQLGTPGFALGAPPPPSPDQGDIWHTEAGDPWGGKLGQTPAPHRNT